jgi:hypothetical protein
VQIIPKMIRKTIRRISSIDMNKNSFLMCKK